MSAYDDEIDREDRERAARYKCPPEEGCCGSCVDDYEAGFGDDLGYWCCCRAIRRADADAAARADLLGDNR